MNLMAKEVLFIKICLPKHQQDDHKTADEVANVAELLMSEKGSFITGADFLVDGGATAAYFYGDLNK